MPIHYQIDIEKRLVVAHGSGVITDQDVFGYQLDVWARAEVAGFDELVDMTAVERIDPPSAERVRELAGLSAGMDPRSAPSRFAIVAPQDVAYGLGRMYGANRDMDERSTKRVEVFRTLEEALAFLGIESLA